MFIPQVLRKRLHRWALQRLALPLVNREIEDQGLHLYRYVPSTDRLFPYRQLSATLLDRQSAGSILSDRWYRVLRERRLRVSVAFDVGVNYGYTSAWLSDWADKVYAFEPNPTNVEMINEQLRIRHIRNVCLVPTAVSDHAGTAVLHIKPYDGHHSLADIGASETVGRINVPLLTLDGFAKDHGIARVGLLKVDVEGFEAEVFRGASHLLASNAVDLVLFEYSPRFYRQRGMDHRTPLHELLNHGYRIENLDGQLVDIPLYSPR